MKSLNVLYLEDDPNDINLVRSMLIGEYPDCNFTSVDTRADFEKVIAEHEVQILLVDYKLPSFDGMTALEIAKEQCPNVPFIFVSGVLGEEVAIESLKMGATDYVLKNRLERLVPATQRALREAEERKRLQLAEAEREETVRELRRRNAELEDFAYLASHDLQEPLRKVTNFAQLLSKRYSNQLDPRADTYIGYLVDGASRMQKLIQDLLAYSRIGRTEAIEEVVDLTAVLSEIKSDLAISIKETRAEIHFSNLPKVVANRMQIKQLLQNLIANAIKYRKEEPPCIRIAGESKDAVWWFSVADNGIGIDPQFSDRIFRIFQRLHTTEEYPGTGVGLAICKKIVEQHSGHIWFESNPGSGATFFFTIKRKKGN